MKTNNIYPGPHDLVRHRQKKTGERTGRKRCQFLLGPQASTELFGPTGGGITKKTHRTAHAGGGGGSGAPKCCRSCLGRRVAEKLRGDDKAEALPIFYWASKRRRSWLVRPEEKLRGQQDGTEALPICCGAPKHRLDRPEENFRGKPDRA